MTLLIVLLSLTNIAVGYGLAIYLGHSQPFWGMTSRGARKKPVGRSTDRYEPSQGATADAEPMRPSQAAPPSQPVAQLPAKEETQDSRPVETAMAGSGTESPPSEESDTEELSLKDTLKDLEEFREQVHEQESPPTLEESLAGESKGDTESSESSDSEASESSDAGASDTEPADEEDLLKGIGAFQEQLKKQQELSKIPNQ